MAEGGARRLRPWLLAQLESGRFRGLEWDDEARSALRVPWAHGRRGGSKGGAGAALCKAWAEYKGRVRPGDPPDPAGWKTRLRCALARCPEFVEVPPRGRRDGPCPYRVYRLLPPRESKPPRPRPELPPLQIVVESPEPLPPAQGDFALLLRLRRGALELHQGALPPGEYLLSPPGRQGAPPPPGALPRVVLPEGAGLGRGFLLSSAPRGLFLRARPGAPPGGTLRGPHVTAGPVQQGALLQPFDGRRFRHGEGRGLTGGWGYGTSGMSEGAGLNGGWGYGTSGMSEGRGLTGVGLRHFRDE
ncbi:interferon regulatory factor 4-like [Myiozetetes cayanensis]|uniref:interferon regulatory factor 4-like n=1 Tax=Myiozetetes cayanensis TaxID=478635 RepID=UPI00215F4D2F|nr:interferon regulatory factor 4-like [Myiozetetes cayanensis]